MFPLKLQITHRQKDEPTLIFFAILPEPGLYTVGRASDQSIVIKDSRISARHLELDVGHTRIVVEDVGSKNGTFCTGRRIRKQEWNLSNPLLLAGVVEVASTNETEPQYTFIVKGQIKTDPGSDVVLHQQLYKGQEIVDFAMIKDSAFLRFEKEFLAIGGGLGSFTWVDHLRVFGAKQERIGVIGEDAGCYTNCQRYLRASQFLFDDRLRSNSGSTPDNLWGFPGYALREAFSVVRTGKRGELKGIFEVFCEPALGTNYAPRASAVFASLDKEMERIGWKRMFRPGIVLAVRKTNDGRYAVFFKNLDGSADPVTEGQHSIAIANHIHVATGYPSVNFASVLAEFRNSNRSHSRYVVNAYEDHQNVYDNVAKGNCGAVIVLGEGFLASRILERLAKTISTSEVSATIVHVMRAEKDSHSGARHGKARRAVLNDFEVQPFDWPKACWGGELRVQLEALPQDLRAKAFAALGSATIPSRYGWMEIIERGIQEGWYSRIYGSIVALEPTGFGVKAKIIQSGDGSQSGKIDASYILDCSELVGDVKNSHFLSDLVATYALEQNRKLTGGGGGGISVSRDFEIEGMRNGSGRVYASGQICNGGYYGPVDTFMGLQFAALRSVDQLSSVSGSMRSIGPMRSFLAWIKWCMGRAP